MSRINEMILDSQRVFELNNVKIEQRKSEKYYKNKIQNEYYRDRMRTWKMYMNVFNPGHIQNWDKVKHSKRRAIEKNLPNDTNSKEWQTYLLNQFNNKCPLTSSSDIHLDHFIPVAWGHGGHYIGNIIPLESTLNQSKSDKNPFEWIKLREDIDKNKFNDLITHLAKLNNMDVEEFIEYTYWCEKNKRIGEELIKSNKSSVELFKESKLYITL